MEENNWYGWKEIKLEDDLFGEEVVNDIGFKKLKHRYIKIPNGYGYDNYCFLLSTNCISDNYISIAADMKIELLYDPEKRAEGKRYKRYKISGYELFENIFSAYENNIYEKWVKKEKLRISKQEKEDKKTTGDIVIGRYKGNTYSDKDMKYKQQEHLDIFFKSKNGRFSNDTFSKVENVKIEFYVIKNTNKYFFKKQSIRDIIKAYLNQYNTYNSIIQIIDCENDKYKSYNTNKAYRKIYPECGVKNSFIETLHEIRLLTENKKEECIIELKARIEELSEMYKK